MMIPVSELTTEQAVAELEQLLDAKPDEGQVIERARWLKTHGDRVAALEARIDEIASAPAPKGAPEPREEPEAPSPKFDPKDLLVKKEAKYREVHARLVANPADQKTRTRLNMLRFEVRDLAKRAGVPVPEIPEPPASPLATPPKAKQEEKAAEQEPKDPPVLIVKGVDIPLGTRFVPLHDSTPLQSVARVRREIWLLMAELEQMTPAERATLSQEIGLLDAAAHAALGLTTGQLQVV